MNSSVRNAVLWLIILCLVVLAWAVFKTSKSPGKSPSFSELYKDVQGGLVESIVINAATGDVKGKYKNTEEFHSTVPPAYSDFQSSCSKKAWSSKSRRTTTETGSPSW